MFTYVLTYGGAAASVVSPFLGLLVYICFATIKPEHFWFWSVPQGNYSRIVAIGLLGGWFFTGFGDWRLGRATAIVACLIGYLAFMAMSATGAVYDAARSWQLVEQVAKIVLPFVVGITIINSVAQLKAVVYVIAATMTFIAYEMNIAYYGGSNRMYAYGFGGLDNNGAAVTMVTAVGLTFYLALAERRWWLSLAWFASIALMINCIMMSYSRGGLLALIITGSLGFVLVQKRTSHYLLFAVVIMLAFRLAGPEVVDRFLTTFAEKTERDQSAESRLGLWKNCLELAGEHPLLGIGPQQFPLMSHEFGWDEGKQAHTTWLQIAAEQGITGFLLIAGFYWLTIWRLWRARWQLAARDPWLLDLVRMTVASLVGFGVAAQFVSLQAMEMPYYIAMVGASALKLTTVGRTQGDCLSDVC